MRNLTCLIGQATQYARLGVLAASLGAMLQAPAAQAEELDVIQYNVQFVAPWDFSRASLGHYPNTGERAHAIGRALACFDIVALNETINDSRRREILVAMELAAPGCGKAPRFEAGRHFEIFAGPKLAPGENRLGSLTALADFAASEVPLAAVDDELALISRLPIVERNMHVYGMGRGTDALAAKGVLHARVLGDGPAGGAIDVFATHLQANHSDIRRVQIAELARFIRAQSDPSLPALLLGDFNVDGGFAARWKADGEYRSLMRELTALGFLDPGLTLGGTDGWRRRRIDHIFLRPRGLRPLELRIEGMRGPDDVALSDHAAVVARLRWPGRGAPLSAGFGGLRKQRPAKGQLRPAELRQR